MEKEEIVKQIVNSVQYGGNSEANRKAISASEFGNDILQIYLRQKHGVIPETKFTQATIGSLIHKPIQEALKDEYKSEETYEVCMSDDDWFLTGSVDLINDEEIIDIKVTKQYTVQKVLKDIDHQYIWQLSVYRYLHWVLTDEVLNTKLLLVLKDGGMNFRKMIEEPSIEVIEIMPKSFEEVEEKFYSIIDELKRYEELGEEPPQCSDLWFRKTKNGAIPMRCEYYCSYGKAGLCPYYKPNPNKINF